MNQLATMDTALLQSAEKYLGATLSENTKRAYRQAWAAFSEWCEASGIRPLPCKPVVVAAYLSACADAGLNPTTLNGYRAAISKAHTAGRHPDPTTDPQVADVMAGIRRTHGKAPRQATALLTPDIRKMVRVCDPTLRGLRDKALLLLGFATGCRRAELCALDVADVQFTTEGVLVTIRRSKTDQEAAGYVKGVVHGHGDTCPVTALRQWIDAAGLPDGPLFLGVNRHGTGKHKRLNPNQVAFILKRLARAAGIDDEKVSGHSLRAGMVTQAVRSGAGVDTIMRQSGHRKADTVHRYIRRATVFEDNASAALGL